MAGLNELLTGFDTKFFDGADIDTTATSSAIDFGGTGQLGAIEIVMQADTAIQVAIGEAVKFELLDESDNVLYTMFDTGTVSGSAVDYAADDIIRKFVLPSNISDIVASSAATGMKVKLTSSAVDNGTFSVFANYLAR